MNAIRSVIEEILRAKGLASLHSRFQYEVFETETEEKGSSFESYLLHFQKEDVAIRHIHDCIEGKYTDTGESPPLLNHLLYIISVRLFVRPSFSGKVPGRSQPNLAPTFLMMTRR